MFSKWFRDFLVGKNTSILTIEAEYKHVILRGNLALVGFIVGFAYIFIDHANNIYGNEPYYVADCLVSLITVFLIRSGKYKLASILFVAILNFVVFLFAASDDYRSGVYIFFIATSLTAFVLFGYKDRRIAFFFIGLSLVLFLYSYYGEHSILQKRYFTERSLQINFTINFIVALITCLATVYFLIQVNFNSEKQILAKNEQLAKANAELDRFVYSASHDMRAPLSSILGLVQVYHLTDLESEKGKILGLIENRANKLDEFIREILDYSRNARLEVKSEPLNCNHLVHEIIEGLRYSKDFEKIQINIDVPPDTIVNTDHERMEVILNNILANAVKYFDPSKQSTVTVTFRRRLGFWGIVIDDNGIGIKAEHQTKIFDMFYRAHEGSEGSGLGLYIVREAVDRLGGTITMRSEFGTGSSFSLEFPDAAVLPS